VVAATTISLQSGSTEPPVCMQRNNADRTLVVDGTGNRAARSEVVDRVDDVVGEWHSPIRDARNRGGGVDDERRVWRRQMDTFAHLTNGSRSARLRHMEKSPRVNATHGTVVHVVGARQHRPNAARNLSPTDCPFCVGGLDSPEPYTVRSFPNRWPALPDGRCEVILYSPEHDASLATLPHENVRQLVELWTDRTRHFSERGDISTLMIFENRGADVGATIEHPHGQLYAFDHVPARSAERLTWTPPRSPERHVASEHGWNVAVPDASEYPVALELWPTEQVGDLTQLADSARDGLTRLLQHTMNALDSLYGQPLPYMMWFNQRDFSDSSPNTAMPSRPSHRLHIEIVSPWRAPGVMRYIAGVEVSTGEFFNPVVPEELAEKLRQMFGAIGGNSA